MQDRPDFDSSEHPALNDEQEAEIARMLARWRAAQDADVVSLDAKRPRQSED